MLIPDPDNNHRVGLVGYDGEGPNSLEFHELSDDFISLKSEVNSWETISGGTAICNGINRAAKEFRDNSDDTTFKVIIVMSDGVANEGCIEQNTNDAINDAIKAACEAVKDADGKSWDNFVLHAVGFGENADEQTLIDIVEEAKECGASNAGTYFDAAGDLIVLYNNIANQIVNLYKDIQPYDYLLIAIYTDVDTYRQQIYDVPNILQSKDFEFSDIIGDVESVEIYPVVVLSNGEEIIGPLLDSWDIS